MTAASLPHGDHHVTIGLRDVYNEIQTLSHGYTRLEGKLDTALSVQTIHLNSIGREISDTQTQTRELEVRLRAVERQPVVTPRAVWTAVGVLIAALGVATGLLSLILR